MISALPSFQEIERVAVACPLGLRFRDAATQAFVSEGLLVEARWPDDPYAQDPRRRWPAQPNRSGVFAFHHLPGLRSFEQRREDGSPARPVPTPRSFLVEVSDTRGRFLPCQFAVTAPELVLPGSGEISSPPSAPWRVVDLYSAPGRSVPGGCAVVRSDLAEWETRRPAAWALVEISTPIRERWVRARGLSDRDGHLTLIFPYPETVDVLTSPVGGPKLLSEQSWPLQFQVWHTFAPEPGVRADLDPLLARIESEAPDTLLVSTSPPEEFSGADLFLGRELVVPAAGLGESRQLFITPAGSPP